MPEKFQMTSDLIIALAILAVELGMNVWNNLESVKSGKFPVFNELITMNDETQVKIDSQKPK